jgi:hypothetical protein
VAEEVAPEVAPEVAEAQGAFELVAEEAGSGPVAAEAGCGPAEVAEE